MTDLFNAGIGRGRRQRGWKEEEKEQEEEEEEEPVEEEAETETQTRDRIRWERKTPTVEEEWSEEEGVRTKDEGRRREIERFI